MASSCGSLWPVRMRSQMPGFPFILQFGPFLVICEQKHSALCLPPRFILGDIRVSQPFRHLYNYCKPRVNQTIQQIGGFSESSVCPSRRAQNRCMMNLLYMICDFLETTSNAIPTENPTLHTKVGPSTCLNKVCTTLGLFILRSFAETWRTPQLFSHIYFPPPPVQMCSQDSSHDEKCDICAIA